MNTETFTLHEWQGTTTVHPVGLAMLLTLGLAMLLLPHRYAILSMLTMACFIAPAQRVVVMSMNFDFLRIMVLFGTVRLLFRGEWRNFRWRTMDIVLVSWALCATMAYIAQQASPEAAKYKLGVLYDVIGMYFLFRCLVCDWSDVTMLAKGAALLAIPVAFAFFVEHASGRNIFAAFGGVPEMTLIRGDRLRCQGAFAHPILAGCFWATLMPLIGAQWWEGSKGRFMAVVGLGFSSVIVALCASSTPVAAVCFAAIGALLFLLRRHMQLVRWGLLITLVVLHLCMQKPVWHLIARIDFAGGSTGWHRYFLMDQAIQRFGEWWLVGIPSTAHWGDGLEDVTNQFVLEGVTGGVVSLVLFVALIIVAFNQAGRLWRREAGNVRQTAFAWALGVAMFVHVTSFLAVTYFGQINMLWYMTLAMIASANTFKTKTSAPRIRRRIFRIFYPAPTLSPA